MAASEANNRLLTQGRSLMQSNCVLFKTFCLLTCLYLLRQRVRLIQRTHLPIALIYTHLTVSIKCTLPSAGPTYPTLLGDQTEGLVIIQKSPHAGSDQVTKFHSTCSLLETPLCLDDKVHLQRSKRNTKNLGLPCDFESAEILMSHLLGVHLHLNLHS